MSEEPGVIRKKQIQSLANAFGLVPASYNVNVSNGSQSRRELDSLRSDDISSLIGFIVEARFLSLRKYSDYSELVQKSFAKVLAAYGSIPNSRLNRKVNIRWMYTDLLKYRIEMYKMTVPFSGMLEGFSVGLLYSKCLQQDLNNVIANNITEIDAVLCNILDPFGMKISYHELVDLHGYPDVDLDKIDLEWRNNQY
ncbi:MAG: hypothetical protein R3F28_13050 [Candidatus Kapaibacterium sp.]